VLLAAFIDMHEGTAAPAALTMLSKDVRVAMPPLPHVVVGIDAFALLLERARNCTATGEWRLVPTWCNRQPAAIAYLRRPGDTIIRAFKIDVPHVVDGSCVSSASAHRPTRRLPARRPTHRSWCYRRHHHMRPAPPTA
jgi:hypothetical protein